MANHEINKRAGTKAITSLPGHRHINQKTSPLPISGQVVQKLPECANTGGTVSEPHLCNSLCHTVREKSPPYGEKNEGAKLTGGLVRKKAKFMLPL